MRTVVTTVIFGMICSMTAYAQGGQLGPWAQYIPDPDTFDWTAQDRPGYRYRGMTPTHERFYEYIQDKRNRGVALSWADRMMIRRLQSARRWPEAPEPNEKWKSFLRYLRELPTMQLNVAQSMMFVQARAQGILPTDPNLDGNAQRIAEHLSSRPYRARNWFERTFGRVDPWMEMVAAASGADMRDDRGDEAGAASGEVEWGGQRIRYSVSGASLGEFEEGRQGRDTWNRRYTGTVAPGRITVSGSAGLEMGDGGRVVVRLSAGGESDEQTVDIGAGGSQNFSVSVAVPQDANLRAGGSFSINLVGNYHLAGRGSGRRSLSLNVGGNLWEGEGAAAARRDREDAEWRAEVERTLRELGYQQSPAGREVARMQQALRGGEGAWQEYVDERHRELAGQETEVERDFDRLQQALAAGGDVWDNYVRTGGAQAPPPQPPLPPEETAPRPTPADPQPAEMPGDIGGLQVGTGADGGRVIGAANHFDRADGLTGVQHYDNQPDGIVAVAIWERDGNELARGERPIGGTGWVSFSIAMQEGRDLPPGRYTLTITVGNTVLGRKSFTIGGGVG